MNSLLLAICVLFVGAGISAHAQPVFPYEQFENDYPAPEIYAQRRTTLLKELPSTSALVVLSADVRNRWNDVDYEYRQNSNMLYLCGYQFPHSQLLLVPEGITIGSKKVHSVLFVRKRNTAREQWMGIEMGITEAQQYLQLDTVLENTEFTTVLRPYLEKIDTLFVASWPTKSVSAPLAARNVYIDAESKAALQEIDSTLQITTTIPVLNRMRMIKDTCELRLMRKAIDISIQGHLALIRGAKPGMKEYQLEALMEFAFKDGGAEFEGYPSIVGSNYNSCVLHYTSNRRTTKINDLVLADCGAEYHGYTADITRTIPINGVFSAEQRAIYNIVLEAQDSGIAACKPGAEFRAPHLAARRVIIKGLKNLGIISADSSVKQYFMHGTSHYLGLDVHDVGDGQPLVENTVITVEPGIYIAPGSDCDSKWWNIGVRIEDDILITATSQENLSARLPRTIQDLETLMRKK